MFRRERRMFEGYQQPPSSLWNAWYDIGMPAILDSSRLDVKLFGEAFS
jgi:hypothetical protein